MKKTITDCIEKGFNKSKKEVEKIYDNNQYDFLLLENSNFKIEDKKEWIEESEWAVTHKERDIPENELKKWKYVNGNLIRLFNTSRPDDYKKALGPER